MFKPLIFVFSLIVLLSGCSPFGSDKDVRKPLGDGLSPKALYELAEDKIDAGSIDQAIEQFEVIISAYPSSKYALQARLDIAYNLFKRKKHNRAILQLDDFIERYPDLESTPYAYYLRGVIAEDKSSSILDDIITESAQRDVQSVRDAYDYFSLLIEKFPNSKYSEELMGFSNYLSPRERELFAPMKLGTNEIMVRKHSLVNKTDSEYDRLRRTLGWRLRLFGTWQIPTIDDLHAFDRQRHGGVDDALT